MIEYDLLINLRVSLPTHRPQHTDDAQEEESVAQEESAEVTTDQAVQDDEVVST